MQPNGVSSQPAPVKNRPRPRPAFRGGRSGSPAAETASQLSQLTEEERTPEPEAVAQNPATNGHHDTTESQDITSPRVESSQITPPSKKRARDDNDGEDTEGALAEDGEGAAEPDATQASEIVVRRKRVRH